jgi:hypothetical protein
MNHVTLAEQLERLREEATWRSKGHHAITLTKEPGLRLVLMLFGEGPSSPSIGPPGP